MTERNEICAVLPVYKEQGWTSFDVVAKLRGILHIKRLGHTGTLDPMAEGVLPVLVGKAAKACDILPESGKTYRAGFRLGAETDTQDITGKVLFTSDKAVTEEELLETLTRFEGDIMQTPPMYSAVKVDGKRLYDLARQGVTVEREAKLRHIDFIKLLSYNEASREGELLTSVSKGTYIRTLINDIGNALGSHGIMTSLLRTKAAGIDASRCLRLDEIQTAVNEGRLSEILMPLDKLFECYDGITLSGHNTKMYKNGVKLRLEQVGLDFTESLIRIYGSDGEFLGLAKTDSTESVLRCYKNFY